MYKGVYVCVFIFSQSGERNEGIRRLDEREREANPYTLATPLWLDEPTWHSVEPKQKVAHENVCHPTPLFSDFFCFLLLLLIF